MDTAMISYVLVAGVLLAVTSECKVRRKQFSAERKLFEYVVSRYDRSARPVLKANTTVTVNFSIGLQQIVDVLEKNQTLVSQLWIYEEWRDELITWRPAAYGGLRYIALPTWSIWLPDFYIFNNAEKGSRGFVHVNDSRVLIHHDGLIEWKIPMTIKSSCAMDVLYFPFDNQHCFIRFGSWVYDLDQLDIVKKADSVDMSQFITHNEFDVINITLVREVLSYDVFTGKFPQMIVKFHIRRKPLYYAYTVIAPTIVLCIVTFSSFFLPCDSGAKVGIGLTVFLSLHVLQLACAENIPESNNLPLLGLFLTLVMTLNCISLLFATFVINLKKKGDKKGCPEVHPILLKVCKYLLGKLTCTRLLGYYDFYDVCENYPSRMGSLEDLNSRGSEDEDDYTPKPNMLAIPGITLVNQNRRRSNASLRGETSQAVRSQNGRLYSSVSQEGAAQARDLRLEWYFVAEVLDKTLMFIFLLGMLLTIVMSLIVIPWIHADHSISQRHSPDQSVLQAF